jgi:RNase P subunit RPR2
MSAQQILVNILGGKCVNCGSTEKLYLHHKNRKRQNNDISNIALLCKTCHWKAHAEIYAAEKTEKAKVQIQEKTEAEGNAMTEKKPKSEPSCHNVEEVSSRKPNMYRENRRSINGFVGCGHDCVYCKPSFQRQMKRQKCSACKTFIPHHHIERLDRVPPKTRQGEFIFFPSSGDLAFAIPEVVRAHIDYARKYPDRTFLIQSKNPEFLKDYNFPDNVILGTTIETNLAVFDTPSKYSYYSEISKALYPCHRIRSIMDVVHKRKSVTIEPILDFTLNVMVEWMERIRPEIIWIGYDNHNCRLPEPTLKKTMLLIVELGKRGFDVRKKTLRKAWYEV